MDLEELTPLVEAWYEVPPGGLGLGDEKIATVENLTLRKFYAKLGQLTEIGTPWWSTGGQDEFLPVERLRQEDGLTIFGVENQGNFVIAASSDANTNAFASGIELDHVSTFTDVGAPLEEVIVTFVLREMVWTGRPFDRDAAADMERKARDGIHYRGRYVFRDEYDDLWLANDAILMEWSGHRLIVSKGAWRQTPENVTSDQGFGGSDDHNDGARGTQSLRRGTLLRPNFGAPLLIVSLAVSLALVFSHIDGAPLLIGLCLIGAVIGAMAMVMATHREQQPRRPSLE
ncbi:MAG: hypothetical protein HY054_02190 [Proteobacteria bacterium]|nr:hypothetical protein [Pseudomonadota bacterium]